MATPADTQKMKRMNGHKVLWWILGIVGSITVCLIVAAVIGMNVHVGDGDVHENREKKENRIKALTHDFYTRTIKPDLKAMEERMVREIQAGKR